MKQHGSKPRREAWNPFTWPFRWIRNAYLAGAVVAAVITWWLRSERLYVPLLWVVPAVVTVVLAGGGMIAERSRLEFERDRDDEPRP